MSDGRDAPSFSTAPALAPVLAPQRPHAPPHNRVRIAIVGSGLAALSAAIFLEQEQERRLVDNRKAQPQIIEGISNGAPSLCRRQRHEPSPHHDQIPAASWTVTLYERDDSFESRRDGYGLTLKYDPNSVLQKLGILEELCRLDCPSRSHYILSEDGTVTGYYGNAFVDGGDDGGKPSESRHGRGYGQRGNLRVPRQLVRRAMMNRLKHTTIEWGHRLVRLEAVPCGSNDEDACDDHGKFESNVMGANGRRATTRKTKVRCCFADGSSVVADWVLGADGVRSTVVQQHSALLNSHLLDLQRHKANHYPDLPQPAAPPPLHRLGIRLIVGLSTLHESHIKDPKYQCLIDERGFYTLAHESRLFVMPYGAPTPLHPNQSREYMWQLSFRERDTCPGDKDDDDLTTRRKYGDPQTLLDEAVARCREWHDPVLLLLRSTPLDTVWSASLFDRDPQALCRHWESLRQQIGAYDTNCNDTSDSGSLGLRRPLPILAVGDALHAMSCFKGQGAHQALKDGQCASKWAVKAMLGRCSVGSAVTACHREIVQRTRGVVMDSRLAADELHLGQDLCDESDGAASCSNGRPLEPVFAGVPDPRESKKLLDLLRSRGIRAGVTPDLDATIGRVLDEVQAGMVRPDSSASIPSLPDKKDRVTMISSPPPPPSMPSPISWTQSALLAARKCDVAELRRLSWISKDARWMPASADEDGNTCLHLAVAGAARSIRLHDDSVPVADDETAAASVDQLEAIQWLVREAGCSCRATNRHGQIPVDLVAPDDNNECRRLLHVLDVQQQQQQHQQQQQQQRQQQAGAAL